LQQQKQMENNLKVIELEEKQNTKTEKTLQAHVIKNEQINLSSSKRDKRMFSASLRKNQLE